jgi:predicted RNase H-like HicB family nuclease
MAERRKIKIIVEKHDDGYVAYPVGMKGIVVGQGDTHDSALENVRSAINFHLETFGPDTIGQDDSDEV